MAGNVQEKQLRWYNIALMSFITVWGFGNVVNNYANQGLVVVFSWVFIFALYFTPYALIVGQLGSCNQVNHLIPTRVLVKGGEITCKILK